MGVAFLCSGLSTELKTLKTWDQTVVNDSLFYQGVVFEILQHSLDAVKCVDGNKVYLKAERILPSEEGLLLLGDDTSTLLLPELYSDKQGCYLKSYVTWSFDLYKNIEEIDEYNGLRNHNSSNR